MAITVTCPGCGKNLKAPDALAGKKARCPGCGSQIQVPASDTASELSAPVPEAAKSRARAEPVSPGSDTPTPSLEASGKTRRHRIVVVVGIILLVVVLVALAAAVLGLRKPPLTNVTPQKVASVLKDPDKAGKEKCRQMLDRIVGKRVKWTLYPSSQSMFSSEEGEVLGWLRITPLKSKDPEGGLVRIHFDKRKHARFLTLVQNNPSRAMS